MLKYTTLAVLCGALGACGSSGGSTSAAPPTDVDSGVFTPAVQTIVVEDSGGGFAPQPPPGSTCTVGAKQFTLTVGSRNLDWSRCVGSSSSAYHPVPGSRVLSTDEYNMLEPTLQSLKVVGPTGNCIADASMLTVTVTTPGGQQEYVDDGYQCSVKDKPYLDRSSIQSALDALNSLAGS